MEHRVEGRDLEHADERHAEHLRHVLYRGLGDPAFLLLCAPQKRDDRGGLPPLRKFGDLPLRPGTVFRREGKDSRVALLRDGGRP